MNTVIIELLDTLNISKENIPICIETGTHRGAGSESFSTIFKRVYTIELSETLFKKNLEKYKNFNNITFMLGKSSEVLSMLIPTIKDKYFLFLDAHGSGGDTVFDEKTGRYGSPVLEEILACSSNLPEYIVIDDLRDFINLKTYPKIEEIKLKVNSIGKYNLTILPIRKGFLVFNKIYE